MYTFIGKIIFKKLRNILSLGLMIVCRINRFLSQNICLNKCNLVFYPAFFIFFQQDRTNATSSCAGLFIGAHLGFDYPGSWIHVDMASPVHCVNVLIYFLVCVLW